MALSDILDRMDLDIYRIFYLKATEYTFFSRTHETFSTIDTLGHKTSFNKLSKIESFFSDCGIKLRNQ